MGDVRGMFHVGLEMNKIFGQEMENFFLHDKLYELIRQTGMRDQ
jgi:hypothetical protein